MYDIVDFKYIDHIKSSSGTAQDYASEGEQATSNAAETAKHTMTDTYYSAKAELGSAEDSLSNAYHSAKEHIGQE